MTPTPTSVRIRMYNVGFGDCFLLTFAYPDGPRHVLIDFGTMGLPKRNGRRLHGSADIARHIVADCAGGELTAVVATHRHQDHISGFAGTSGEIIEELGPKLVLQPWTEHPDLPEDARSPWPHAPTVHGLRLVNDELERALRDHGLLFVAGSEPTDAEQERWTAGEDRAAGFADDDFDLDQLASTMQHYRTSAHNVEDHGVEDIVFVGNLNIRNEEAVRRLMRMGQDEDAEYLHAGQRTTLQDRLPGVKVHVLGPPTAEQADIATPADDHDTEFWNIARSTWGVGLSGLAFGEHRSHRFSPSTAPPVECRWLASHIQHVRPRDLMAIARDLDHALNNTSLILLFEIWEGIDRKLLLFSGDAQLESWKHCVEDPAIAELLADVDVYKVGHHGSRNATPKVSLWERFRKRAADGGLVTLLSTLDDRHGHRENRTEVPRDTLVAALGRESRLTDTRRLASLPEASGYLDCVVRPGGTTCEPDIEDVAEPEAASGGS